ncbi:hypothetical protein SDC9_84430 [bioreactor metagenome]|uniref:Uncharacterized protein n=1 Tax=bioreactor metagenome TaxID=1076179 RepID=A0A644ZD44_9ZZZZ
MDLLNSPDGSIVNHLLQSSRAVTGLSLISHLSSHVMLASCLRQHSCLIHRMCQGLLRVNVLTPPDGFHADNSVCVVGCGNDNCVDILFPVQHYTIVLVSLGFRVELKYIFHLTAPINVAECHNIFCFGYILQVAASHSTNSNSCNVQLIARGHMPQSGDSMSRNNGQSANGQGRGFNKLSPTDSF